MKLIPKAKGGLSFSLAFAQARKAGLKTFRWRGGTYGTQLRDEVETPKMISMGSALMPGLTPIKNVETLANNRIRTTRNFVDEFNHKYTPQQAQLIVDWAGHKGAMFVEDDNGKAISRIGEALQGNYLEPGFYSNDKAPVVGSGLNEVVVTGHRTHIKPNSEGFIPVSGAEGVGANPVYLNMETGEYFVADKRTGEIFANSPDKNVLRNPNLWLNYHTGRNGDLNQSQDSFDNTRGARIAAYDRLAKNNLQYRIWQNNVDRNQLHNITQAQEKGARYLQMPATIASHALWGAWNPANFDENGNYDWGAYWRGFGFKNGSNGFDWYGPNKDTVTGFGSRMAGLANLFGYDTTSPFAKSMVATGDVAGNAALALLMTAGKSTTGTLKELQAYNVHGKGLSKNGFGFNKGKFGATTAGRPELTTTMLNMKIGDPRVTLPTKNGNVYVGLRPNGWQVAQSVSGFGAPIIKANVVPAYSNTTVTVPGSSGYPVGYSPKDNYSGLLSMPTYPQAETPITIEYEAGKPNAYINWKLKNGLDWRNPYGGGNLQDASLESGVKVNYSSGDVNQMRSKGRSGNRNTRRIKSRLEEGNTDTSNK